MSDCKSCVEISNELERVNAENEQNKKLVAELMAQIEQLKIGAIVAFDPNHKFVDLGEPFDDLHFGQPNEEEREAELVNQLPAFSTLFKSGKLIV
jgi:hypothetical protein